MSDIQLYLFEAERNKPEAQALAKKTASRLQSKDLKLLELVESLGEYLNNDDATIRIRTAAFLADVLSVLPSGVLPRQQRELLSDFVLSRISNGAEAIGHSARALLALEGLGRFDQQRIDKVLNTLLDHASPLVQFKQQTERLEVLKLFDVLFSKYRKELASIHDQDPKFIQRLLTCLDGEKDPRNLMIIFSVLNVPMVEWDVSADAQDLFEAVFNYFPITFRPPPNDPYGITAQDLKDRLRDCISSTGYFAPHSFPALLDKLDSTSTNVKRDALQALQACARRYGPTTINLYSITLWDAVKFEILNSQEEDLAEEALKVLFEISYSLSSTTHEGPLQNYLKPICKEGNEHFEDTPTKQSNATAKILKAVGEASAEAVSIIAAAVLPGLLRYYQGSESIPRRRGLLEAIIKVIRANASVFGNWRQDERPSSEYRSADIPSDRAASPRVLNEFSEQAQDLLTSAVENTPITEVSYRILALEGLESLALVRALLDAASLESMIKTLDDIIINEEPYGRDEVKAKAIDVLVAIARQKPQLVMDHAFPAFMAQLPDTDTDSSKHYVPILEALAKLSAEAQVFNTIVIRLKNKLYTALRHKASAKYVNSILSALLYAFQSGSIDLSSSAHFAPSYSDVVLPLLKDVIANGSSNSSDSPALGRETIYDLIGRICNAIVRQQPFAAQTELSRNVYLLFREVDPASIVPFSETVTDQSLTMLTSTHILSALRTEAKPSTDCGALLGALVDLVQKPSIPVAVATTSTVQVSLLVNKFISASEVARVVMPFLEETGQLLSMQRLSPMSLSVAFAMVKALVLRADPKLKIILPDLIRHLSDPTYGAFTAGAFAGLIAPDPYLTKDNHCKIYSIYRQRFFALVAPLLISSYRSAAASDSSDSDISKANYLIALSGIVQHIPYELLQSQLEDLAAPLLQSLTLHNAEVQASAIATISKIVIHDSKILESHASSLISRLLDVAVSPDNTSAISSSAPAPKYPQLEASAAKGSTSTATSLPKVRAAALACLGSFVGSLKDENLVPYQRQTVKRLSAALDDPKRAVRAEAVRCRAAWLGLAGADDDDDDY